MVSPGERQPDEVPGWRFYPSCVGGWIAVRSDDLSEALIRRGLSQVLCDESLSVLKIRVAQEHRRQYPRTDKAG